MYQKHIPYYFWVVFYSVAVPQPMIYSLVKDPWSSSTLWLLHMKLPHIFVHRFSCEHKFLFLCINTHEWNCGSCGKCMVKLIRNRQLFSRNAALSFIATSNMCSSCSSSSPALETVPCLHFSSAGQCVAITIGLCCISLMTNKDIGHLFMCSLLPLWWNVYQNVLAIFN